MKRFKGFNPMLFAAAVIFLCVTVYSLVSNVTVYVRQRDWPVTTATVIDVAENGKEYNITADYEAGPDAYAENKAASDEMLREACRVEWIG